MPVSIGLLRGINVAGKNKIKMADLREWLTTAGLKSVQTYIQSGNIIFESTKRQITLEKLIRERIKDQTGFEVPVLVRDLPFMKRAVTGSPFKDQQVQFVGTTILSSVPEPSLVKALKAMDFGDDQFSIKKDVISLFCPTGFGRTKLTNNLFEKKLKVCATSRNWKTMNKLIELADR
ncbi:MAG: DUF1697 domain-containing protein [Mariniblastus sp.]